jgi:hypothetical protein
MTDPSEIANNLVAMLQQIPDLVGEMNGDIGRIYAFHDQYPARVSVPLAIHQMPAPGLMIVWQGSGPSGQGGMATWSHRFSMYLRGRQTMDNEPPPYYTLFKLITKGIPAGTTLPMLYATVHPNCEPMDVPTIARITDQEGLDHFEISVAFTEIGDNDE